jgi:hypothetical protein
METLKGKNAGLAVAGALFTLFGLFHLIRLFNPFTVVVAGNGIPVAASIIGLLVAWSLAGWMFYLLRRKADINI